MKTRSIITLITIALLSTGRLFSQENPYDATYLSITKEYTLNPDNSTEFRVSKIQKLHSYRSFHSLYGETFIVYNPEYQKLKINQAATVMADGKRVVTPGNAFNEVLPGFAANAPYFNGLREMVVTHTGLEKGATIHFDYTLASAKGYYPAFFGEELLAETEPVKELNIIVRVPAGTRLNYQLFRINASPVVKKEEGYTTYSWNLKNLPVISAEELQAGGAEQYPRLIFSSLSGYSELVTAFTSQEAFLFKVPDDALKTFSLPAGEQDPLLRALILQERVVQEMNLANVPMTFTGFRLRDPGAVYESNYGRGAEKALLLVGLLRASGLEAVPVAIYRKATWSEKVPVLTGIEDILVRVHPEGYPPVLLSPTTVQPVNPETVLSDKVIVVLDPATPDLVVRINESQQGSINGTYNLFAGADGKLTGTGTVRFGGAFNPFLALSRDRMKAKSYFSGGLRSADIKDVTRSEVTPEYSVVDLSVLKEKAIRKDSLLYYFTLPGMTNGIDGWNIRTLPGKRTTPLEVAAAGSEILNVTLTLPDNFDLFIQEGRSEIRNSAGSFLFEVSRESGKVNIRKELRINSNRIQQPYYIAFKTLMDNWNLPAHREIILIRK